MKKKINKKKVKEVYLIIGMTDKSGSGMSNNLLFNELRRINPKTKIIDMFDIIIIPKQNLRYIFDTQKIMENKNENQYTKNKR